MDPINSWVDAAEMRRLAESLVAPATGPAEGPSVPYGDQFVGFERESAPQRPAADKARAALAGARHAAARGGILQQTREEAAPKASRPITPPQAPPSEDPPPRAKQAPPAAQMSTPQGFLIQRLKAFGEWLHRELSAKAFFVADRGGEPLIDEVQSQKLLQVARTLAQASWTANRQAGVKKSVGSLHVKLGAGSVMEVLTVSSRYGPLILGIIVPALLPAASIGVIAEGLEKAVNAPIQAS